VATTWPCPQAGPRPELGGVDQGLPQAYGLRHQGDTAEPVRRSQGHGVARTDLTVRHQARRAKVGPVLAPRGEMAARRGAVTLGASGDMAPHRDPSAVTVSPKSRGLRSGR
jgi:hypothetical protein